jgi:hypothetical protein
MYSVDRQLAELRRWVGYREGRNNHNVFSAWQYGAPEMSWCVSFHSYCAYQAGLRYTHGQFGEKGFNAGDVFKAWAIRHGVYRPPSAIAKPGWAVFNNFGAHPTQHTGTVIEDLRATKGYIHQIDGNSSDMVADRYRYARHISGFVALDELGQNAPPAPVTPPAPPQPKGNPMYDPPIQIPGGIAATCATKGGHWSVNAVGQVYAFPSEYGGKPPPWHGNVYGKAYWGNRRVEKIREHRYGILHSKRGYIITATTGEEYKLPQGS